MNTHTLFSSVKQDWTTPRQLLQLCDAWGSNAAPEEGENKACATNETP